MREPFPTGLMESTKNLDTTSLTLPFPGMSLMPAEVITQDIANGHLSQLDWTVPFGKGPIGVSLRAQDDLSPAGRAFMVALHKAANTR